MVYCKIILNYYFSAKNATGVALIPVPLYIIEENT